MLSSHSCHTGSSEITHIIPLSKWVRLFCSQKWSCHVWYSGEVYEVRGSLKIPSPWLQLRTLGELRQLLWVLLCNSIISNLSECGWRQIYSLLLIEFVADATKNQSNMFEKKDKRKLMFPVGAAQTMAGIPYSYWRLKFCYWRYRPTKVCLHQPSPVDHGGTEDLFLALFHICCQGRTGITFRVRTPTDTLLLRNSGLFCSMSLSGQVLILNTWLMVSNQVPGAVSIVGIICQALNILCESQGFNVHFANVYLEAIDFVSIRYSV